MSGRWHTRSAVVMCVVLSGCVGLDDPPPGPVAPRPPAATEKPSPDLRITQGPDIPLVPVPPPPIGAKTPPPATPVSRPTPPPSAPPINPTAAPLATPLSQSPPHSARQLLQQAAARYSSMDSYIVRLVRREFLKDKPQPEEIMLFAFRKQPFSVHFKWLGDTARGREVVYVKGRYKNEIHTKLAAGDAPLMPAGTRIGVAPDSFLARAKSRHPITDAGIGHCIDSLIAQLDAQDRGEKREGTLAAIAPQQRAEYPRPVETIERIISPAVEPELPRGGRRLICFDPDWQLPLLVVTYDDTGREVEYYRYDRLQTPVNLDEDDFNPDKLWGAKPAGK